MPPRPVAVAENIVVVDPYALRRLEPEENRAHGVSDHVAVEINAVAHLVESTSISAAVDHRLCTVVAEAAAAEDDVAVSSGKSYEGAFRRVARRRSVVQPAEGAVVEHDVIVQSVRRTGRQVHVIASDLIESVGEALET